MSSDWSLNPANNKYYYFSQIEQCYIYQSGEKIFVYQPPDAGSSIRGLPPSLPEIGNIRLQSIRTESSSISQSGKGPQLRTSFLPLPTSPLPPPPPRPPPRPPPPPHLTVKVRLPRRYKRSPARITKRVAIETLGHGLAPTDVLEVSFSDDGEDNVPTARQEKKKGAINLNTDVAPTPSNLIKGMEKREVATKNDPETTSIAGIPNQKLPSRRVSIPPAYSYSNLNPARYRSYPMAVRNIRQI